MSRMSICPYCGGHQEKIFGAIRCFTSGCPNEVDFNLYEEWEERQWSDTDEWHDEVYEPMIIADHMERALVLVPIHFNENSRVTTWTSQ